MKASITLFITAVLSTMPLKAQNVGVEPNIPVHCKQAKNDGRIVDIVRDVSMSHTKSKVLVHFSVFRGICENLKTKYIAVLPNFHVDFWTKGINLPFKAFPGNYGSEKKGKAYNRVTLELDRSKMFKGSESEEYTFVIKTWSRGKRPDGPTRNSWKLEIFQDQEENLYAQILAN